MQHYEHTKEKPLDPVGKVFDLRHMPRLRQQPLWLLA